jgi:hypothetical protein
MTRSQAISLIEALYPADDGNARTREIGDRLLAEAKREHNVNWRDEPLAVLILYAEKCRREEMRLIREHERQQRGY